MRGTNDKILFRLPSVAVISQIPVSFADSGKTIAGKVSAPAWISRSLTPFKIAFVNGRIAATRMQTPSFVTNLYLEQICET